MRLRYVIAPVIVLIGIGLASVANSIDNNTESKNLLADQVANNLSHPIETVSLISISPKAFNLNEIKSFYDISLKMENFDFVAVQESISISCLGNNFACEGLSSGSALYVANGDKTNLVAMNFKHKMTLNGCQPVISQIYQVDFQKDE